MKVYLMGPKTKKNSVFKLYKNYAAKICPKQELFQLQQIYLPDFRWVFQWILPANSQCAPSMVQMLMFYEIQTIQLLLFPMLESFADCSDTARAKYSRWECPNEIFPDSQITRKVEIYQIKLWFSTLTHSNTVFIAEGIFKLGVFSMVQWYIGWTNLDSWAGGGCRVYVYIFQTLACIILCYWCRCCWADDLIIRWK